LDAKDEILLIKLQATFCVEAEEHVLKLTSDLIELEKAPLSEASVGIIESVFRETHSLKGAARAVGAKDIESLCQVLESIFDKVKNDGFILTTEHFNLIYKTADYLSKLVSGIETKNPKETRELIKQLRTITGEDLSDINTKEQPPDVKITYTETEKPVPSLIGISEAGDLLIKDKPIHFDNVRISTAKLDELFLQAEQMVQSKIAASQRYTDLRNISEFIISLKTDADVFNNEKLNELDSRIASVTGALENDQHTLNRMIDDHLESMKAVLMLPVSVMIEGFPIFVRDLARSQNKEVDFIIHGNDIQVDKRIMDEMKNPLIHLLRNCIDHGIKKPAERESLNKPSHGNVTISFNATESRHLEIVISDDGTGIDPEKVRNAAAKNSAFSKDYLNTLPAQEILMLIFQTGVSTSQMITDISGRGLGLAIVKEKVENLGGTVSVESQANIGTTFRIILPLTLSTFRCLLVRTHDHLFAIPTGNVERVVRIASEELRTIENKNTITIAGKIISTAILANVLKVPCQSKSRQNKNHNSETSLNHIHLLILVNGNTRIAFIVDEILEEYQILVKDLGRQLSRVMNISGAAVLGSGEIVPVINVPDLIKSALQPEHLVNDSEERTTETKEKQRILVIDDSITSRTLIKNIVESAGYIVETAVDGADAFAKALIGEFDLIVSDVDMPRINGFELTAKIRKDKKLSEIPVVLVTALESREDREHGIDVGANAYLVKSSFDQSNLLEVIKRLL